MLPSSQPSKVLPRKYPSPHVGLHIPDEIEYPLEQERQNNFLLERIVQVEQFIRSEQSGSQLLLLVRVYLVLQVVQKD